MFRIKGTLTGLSGSLVLRNNGADDLTVSADGAFTFATAVPSGGAYAVTVASHPTGPTQNCAVNSGSGTVASSDVTSVAVTCVTPTFTVGGTVAGLNGSIVLRNSSGGDVGNVTVTANGAFAFPAQSSGTAYSVQVVSHPAGPSQTCTVANPAGTVAAANVSDVTITCSTDVFPVGGAVSGLTGTGLVLSSNGMTLPVAAGSFAFPAQADGSAYAVTVTTQPSGPSQFCSVTNASGTVAGGAVTSVVVSCTTSVYAVGGSISGYTGSGLVLHNSAGADLHPTSGATSFAFPAQVSGSAYAITVATQPSTPTQSCVVASGSGTIVNANVSNVTITCTTTQFRVGGSVHGLAGSGLVLQNNGGDDKTITAVGAFDFATAVNSGSAYAVTVRTQPSNPSQTCSVTGGASGTGSGMVGAQAVTDIDIACVTNALMVTSKTPLDTIVGTDLLTKVVANFSDKLERTTVTAGSFTLTAPGAMPVTGTLSFPTETQAVLTPSSALAFDTTYTATLTTAVRGQSAPALASNVVWTFNTGKKIAVGGYHVCARLEGADNGKIKCWGSNQHGQLGQQDPIAHGNEPGEMGVNLPPVNLGTGLSVVDISAGQHFNCARLIDAAGADAGIKCWGRNQYGQLGNNLGGAWGTQGVGPGTMGDDLPFLNPGLAAGEHVLEIVTGEVHGCLRVDTGVVKCWGTNYNGVPGQGTSHGASSPTTELAYVNPVVVPLGTGLKAVGLSASGGRHTCARLVDGANAHFLKCWGRNNAGQLGVGDNNDRGDGPNEMGNALPAIDLGTGRHAVQVSTSAYNTCALLDNNDVKCWGNNGYGQLGRGVAGSDDCSANDCIGDGAGEMGDLLPPVSLSTTMTPARVVGGDLQACVLFTTGKIKCWGNNDYGQLGQGNMDQRGDGPGEMGDALSFTELGTGYSAVAVEAGAFHTCAVLSSNAVKCWGFNGTDAEWVTDHPTDVQGGQLGQGDMVNRGDGAGAMGDALPAIDLTP